MTFNHLEQRLAQGYLDLFPSFVPEENAPVSIKEQEDFYNLMKSFYQLAYDDPSLFVTKLNEDDAFPTRIKSRYNKPELIKIMKLFLKSVEETLQYMYQLGKEVINCHPKQMEGSPRCFVPQHDKRGSKSKILDNKIASIFIKLNIKDILPAWRWMATRPDANIISFTYCLFNKEHTYTPDIYARLIDNPAYNRLVVWMTERDYKSYDILHLIGSDCKLSLVYANPKWSKESPRGGSFYKIKHTGIAVEHVRQFQNPTLIGLCIPGGMKDYLNNFAKMSENLQRFIITRTKKCDGCRYCVQTDKKGTRPMAHTRISFEDKEYVLCHLYPGWSYCWTSLNDEIVDNLIEMLEFMDLNKM